MSRATKYGADLAYIHDAGFSEYALGAAPGLLRLLRGNGARSGLVTDLGCGSGRWARALNLAGYEVFGVDQSPAFIKMARRIAPGSTFTVGSLASVELPVSDAVTSIGECVNYCFERTVGPRALARLFTRVYAALTPGGVFVFDAAGPARIPAAPARRCFEGRDWAILVETEGDRTGPRSRAGSSAFVRRASCTGGARRYTGCGSLRLPNCFRR
ncbi:MAG TPA: class I SAM-dependent methyltransferase [Bryobacteraceae bacterium]|nr:class I SAM-dependent methyltransferase [Bryobacteraceae bacterium]